MLYQQNYFNINIKYFENLIKIEILKKFNNNIEKFDLYMYILNILKLNKTEMIITYFNKEYLVFSEKDLLRIFKNF